MGVEKGVHGNEYDFVDRTYLNGIWEGMEAQMGRVGYTHGTGPRINKKKGGGRKKRAISGVPKRKNGHYVLKSKPRRCIKKRTRT